MNLLQKTLTGAAGLLAACAMVACGGGGGGTGPASTAGGSTTTPTTEDGLTVTTSVSSFAFNGFSTTGATTWYVDFSLNNVSKDATYYGGMVDSAGLVRADYKILNTRAAVAVTMPKQNAGQRSGTLKFMLCKDAGCATQIWSNTIPYTSTVFDVSGQAVSMQADEGRDSSTLTVPVTPNDDKHLLTATTSAPWLSVRQDAAAGLQLTASAKNMAAGTYRATVTVAFNGASYPAVDIPVTFTVGSGVTLPAPAPMTLASNQTEAMLTGGMPITFSSGSPAWSAASDQPWLVVTTGSGAGSGAVRYRIDISKLDGVANWTSATANIVLHSASLVDRSIPVTINKALPEIYSVGPSQLPAGAAAMVTVTGRGLAQLSGVGAFRIGGYMASGGSIVSDTSATILLPALAAGRYDVSVANAAGLSSAKGSVSSVAPMKYSYASIADVGAKYHSEFDAMRNALFAVNLDKHTLLRVRLVSGKWVSDALPIPGLKSMAFSPDRKVLYALAQESELPTASSTLIAVDPDTLAVQARYTPPPYTFSTSQPVVLTTNRNFDLTVTSNGRIWFVAYAPVYFDTVKKNFAVLADENANSAAMYGYWAGADLVGPPDGAYFYVLDSSSPLRPLRKYSVDSDKITTAQLGSTGADGEYRRGYVVSNDGTKMLVGRTDLLDVRTNAVLGSFPRVAASEYDYQYVFSPDNRRLYRMVMDGAYVVQRIEVLDVTTRSLIGTIALPDQGSACPLAPNNADGCFGDSFIISPMGDVLFWVGAQKVLVLPIPATFLKQGGAITFKNATN